MSFCMVLLGIGGPRPSRKKKGDEGGKTALLKVQLFYLKRETAALRVVTATRNHDEQQRCKEWRGLTSWTGKWAIESKHCLDGIRIMSE